MRLFAMTLALAAVLSAPAAAQTENPPNNPAGTTPGMPGPDQPNNTDRLFAQLVGAGGHAEVDLGLLAKQQAAGEAVKDFGARMADEHSKANMQLADAAEKAGVAVPDKPDAEHQAMRSRLEKMQGADFDLAYMSGQVRDHIRTVELLSWEINSGQNDDLQRFASDTLPAVLEHLRMAQDLLVQLRSEVAAR